ncbi:DUF5050 domain-containing protein [Brevibacillus porteri]|uniref:DUF5050 domain-containing protein n=1 Tax=Brevibacillus porteri TaxID=2126350 RepID=UPI003D23ED47
MLILVRLMLYKAKINSDKKEEILENADYATVSNGWYYFHDSRDQGLYKMKLDGTEKTKLTKDDTKIDVSKGGSFEVYKALYRTQLASDKTEKIMDMKSDTIVEINVPAQYILYAKTNNEFYKVRWK